MDNNSTFNNTYSWEDICIQLRNKKHALPTITTKLKDAYFSIQFLQTFHRRFANATQVCCVNELVEVGEHEKQTK